MAKLPSKLLCLLLILIEGYNGAKVPNKPSVIVIGSGPSGIAAATKLLNNNFTNVKILEAENRIGGRINSVKFGDAYVDLGAEFCHGETDNIVYSMVKDLDNLRHSNNKLPIFFTSNSSFNGTLDAKLLLENAERFFATNQSIPGCEHVKSIGQCLDIYFNKSTLTPFLANQTNETLQATKTWMSNYLCLYDSPFDLNDLTVTTDYKTCAGDLHMNWNGRGYKTILELMLKNHSKDSLISLGQEVVNITNWTSEENKVMVATKSGKKFEADHVIFTPSVGVLKANHKELFKPILSEEKVEAIESVGFGAALKVVLHFPEKWWRDLESDAFGVIWLEKDVQELKRLGFDWLTGQSQISQAPHNPNVWTVWYAGQFVPHIESLSDKEVFDGHKYFFKHYVRTNLSSEPDKMIRSTWYTNPHFRGTYSYESVKGHSRGGKHFQKTLSVPLENSNGKPTILFAGEATHPYYFSTVHGAIETGYREADRLIKFYQK